MVLEDVQSGWVGAVTRVEKSGGMHVVALEDRRGKSRTFRLGFGFLLEGQPIRLMPPAPRAQAAPAGSNRTASGSVRVAGQRAQVAKASRIWVEGKHDAELVEKVWGDDLRVEGIVVEPLHGIDDLTAAVAAFRPGPGRRLGVLVDHLVADSKESRIADAVMASPGAAGNVLIVGHPYVDVWQAIRPAVLGIDAWPVIPRGRRLEDRNPDGLRLAARDQGRHRPGLAEAAGGRPQLRGPGSVPAGPGGRGHRLPHRAVDGGPVDSPNARP